MRLLYLLVPVLVLVPVPVPVPMPAPAPAPAPVPVLLLSAARTPPDQRRLRQSDLLIGAAVSAWHGKRGWHIIPHADHVLSVYGLVCDGVAFSTAALRGQSSEPRQPLLGSDAGASAERGQSGGGAADEGVMEAQAYGSTAVATGQRTALHAAAAIGDTARLAALLKQAGAAGAVDGPDTRGYTAFHVACAGGHADCVVALCQAGADTELKNDVGLRGWELAAQLHRAEVLGLDRAGLEQVARRARAKAAGRTKGKAAARPGKVEAVAVKKPPSFARHAGEPAGAAVAVGGPKTVVL